MPLLFKRDARVITHGSLAGRHRSTPQNSLMCIFLWKAGAKLAGRVTLLPTSFIQKLTLNTVKSRALNMTAHCLQNFFVDLTLLLNFLFRYFSEALQRIPISVLFMLY